MDEFSDSKKIWDQASFSISTNNYFRLAIASGNDGVLAFIPPSRDIIEDKYITQIVQQTCVDCDWQYERLIANTNDGVDIVDFSPIPSKKDFVGSTSEYWKIVNNIKNREPEVSKLGRINNKKVLNSWQAGDKMFFLTDEGSIAFVKKNDKENYFQDNILSDDIKKVTDEQIVASRTASFGTVIEGNSSLLILGGNEFKSIDESFVTWRVFPRAKNYANHLHIIKDESISISAIEISGFAQDEKGYGFSIDSM